MSASEFANHSMRTSFVFSIFWLIAGLHCVSTPATAAPLPSGEDNVQDRIFRYHITGWGPCSVSCGVGVRYPELNCQRGIGSLHNWETLRWEITTDKKCQKAGEIRPHFNNTKTCQNDPCLANYWVKGHWSQCNASCGGGYRHRPVACYNPNTMKSAEASDCRKAKPRFLQRCNTSPCDGVWFVGKWSNCSSTCGIGVHQRRVVCRSPTGMSFSSQSSRHSVTEPSGCRYLVQPSRTKLCCDDSNCPPEHANICEPPSQASPAAS